MAYQFPSALDIANIAAAEKAKKQQDTADAQELDTNILSLAAGLVDSLATLAFQNNKTLSLAEGGRGVIVSYTDAQGVPRNMATYQYSVNSVDDFTRNLIAQIVTA